MSVNSLVEKIARLPDELKKELDAYINLLLEKAHNQVREENNERTLGIGMGKGWISSDFDEPLEEMKDYME